MPQVRPESPKPGQNPTASSPSAPTLPTHTKAGAAGPLQAWGAAGDWPVPREAQQS